MKLAEVTKFLVLAPITPMTLFLFQLQPNSPLLESTQVEFIQEKPRLENTLVLKTDQLTCL